MNGNVHRRELRLKPPTQRRRKIGKKHRRGGNEIYLFAGHSRRDFARKFDAHGARADDRDAARRSQLFMCV
jgi:hypothetical protein